MKDINILCLSDLHFRQYENDSNLETITRTFLEELERFLHSGHEEWYPDFITVAGDITQSAKREQYHVASCFLHKLTALCKVNDDHVLLTPGNHDIDRSVLKKYYKQLEPEQRKEEYYTKVNRFLDNVLIASKPERTSRKGDDGVDKMIAYCKPFFEPYAKFRKSFAGTYHSLPSFEKSSLKYVNGFTVFEEERIVFLELNTSWLSIHPGEDSKNLLKLGSGIIDYFNNQLMEKKESGYLIFALFHHTLHHLMTEEYQAPNDKFCLYKSLVNLADVLICGPESHDVNISGYEALLEQLFVTDIFNDTGSPAAEKQLTALANVWAQSEERKIKDKDKELVNKIEKNVREIRLSDSYNKLLEMARQIWKETAGQTEFPETGKKVYTEEEIRQKIDELKELSTYSTLLNLSHVILCGHQHGEKVKQADCLANLCQQFMSGAFYERQRKSMSNIECSAYLLKLDRVHNVMYVLEIQGNHEYQMKWSFRTNEIKRYPICLPYSGKDNGYKMDDTRLTYPCIKVKKYNDIKDVERNIVKALFGEKYKLSEGKKLVDTGNIFFRNIVFIMFNPYLEKFVMDPDWGASSIVICWGYLPYRERILRAYNQFCSKNRELLLQRHIMNTLIFVSLFGDPE